MKLRASMTAAVLAASSVAFGVAGLGAVETGSGGIDAYKAQRGDVIDTSPIGEVVRDYDTTRALGMEAVVNVDVGEATDMQFQRRTETVLVDGVETEVVKDYAFVGISDIGGSFNGFDILDISDPENPSSVLPDGRMTCGGFHNDVAVWRDYLVIGHDGSAGPCDTAPMPTYEPGITVFDVSDVTDPQFLFHGVASTGISATDSLLKGVHNISIHPDGIVHFAAASFEVDNPGFGYLDLKGDPAEWEQVAYPIRDISPAATDGCHDMGYDFTGETPLMVCPAIESTFIWDITDPKQPTQVAAIPNPAINIHHGGRFAPDGSTVLLGDELAGAGAPSGCFNGGPVGAIFTYDMTVPAAPVPTGYLSASEGPGAIETCTSHFYNFVPTVDGPQKVVTGWYGGGMVVHDLTPVTEAPVASGGPLGVAPEIAHIEPTGAEMWNAYAYRGYVFGNSYTGTTGFFVATLDDYTGTDDAALAPYCNDVGIVWGPSTDDWQSECRNPGDPIDEPSDDEADEPGAHGRARAAEARAQRDR